MHIRGRKRQRIFRHHNPGHDVGDNAEERHWPYTQNQPDDPNQRYVGAEVTCKTGANACKFGLYYGPTQPIRSQNRRASPGKCSAFGTEFVLLSQLDTALGTEHEITSLRD